MKLVYPLRMLVFLTSVALPICAIGSGPLQTDYLVDFKPIYFSEGSPSIHQMNNDAENSLSVDQIVVLYQLLKALKDHPSTGVEVVGYADKDECRPRECRDLSDRRAKLIYTWLLEHGILKAQLRGPTGKSTDWPLYRSGLAREKAFNRRVQLEPFFQSKRG